MTTIVLTGDTIKIQASFLDENSTLVDADANTIVFKIYDYDTQSLLTEAVSIRTSQGIYHYKYLVPDTETKYIVELGGDFTGRPQVERAVIKAKFRT